MDSVSTRWKELMERVFFLQATDIHIEEERITYLRYGSHFEGFPEYGNFSKEFLRTELKDAGKTGDFGYFYEGRRFRVHQYYSDGRTCYTLRVLPAIMGKVEEDIHSAFWKEICSFEEGLILVTGPTGSGKSYMLASCLSYINRHFAKHIITLEDPIEYYYVNEKSCFHQRELNRDIASMEEGLKGALREDPDIIMVGEMRDMATMEAALKAAETGHLVFATLHTGTSIQAIGRILSSFSSERQEEVRNTLSTVLRAVVCQRLLRSGTSLYPLRDILMNTPAVGNLIRKSKDHQIISIQETYRPMQTFEYAIREGEKHWQAPYDWRPLKLLYGRKDKE